MLIIESLSKGFTRRIKNRAGINGNEQHFIINRLNINIPHGKIVALIGGNGAGKTTLFNIISGFLRPDQGSVKFLTNGSYNDLLSISPSRISNLGIGRMFQDNHILLEVSVLDNMLIAAPNSYNESPLFSIFSRKKIQSDEAKQIKKVQSVFNELFGADNPFWKQRHAPAGTLSYGQQRLLGLARLFMRDYKLLLLDEPTAGVNPIIIDQIKTIIKKLRSNNQTIFLIEHNMEVVLDIADECYYMDQGIILRKGTPQEVIHSEEVKKSYLGVNYA